MCRGTHNGTSTEDEADSGGEDQTDSIDSESLAQLLRAGLIPEAYAPSVETRDKKALLRYRSTLTGVKVMLKNIVHSVLARNHIEDPAFRGLSDKFGKKGKSYLRSVTLRGNDTEILNNYLDLLEDVEATRAEVAGPGFLNFTFSDVAWRARLGEILRHGQRYGSSAIGGGARLQVEFVSANPTGPLHVGHGRGAAVGDAIARILEAAGYHVDREYYVNDAGNQMETLGRSIWARYMALAGREVEFPNDGYPGEYVTDLAPELATRDGAKWLDVGPREAAAYMSCWGGEQMLERIRSDLGVLGIRFDRFKDIDGGHIRLKPNHVDRL